MDMKIPSHQLEAFVTVAQTGHFTKAAKVLNVTQSALSQRILNLEDFLQSSLIVRDRGGVRLTAKGESLLRYCHLQQQMESELLSHLNDPQGFSFQPTLRIAAFSSVARSIVVPALSPMVSSDHVQFHLLTRELSELSSMLHRSEVDYLITDHKNHQQKIESLFLGFEENVLIVQKGSKKDELVWILDHDETDEVSHRYVKFAKLNAKKLHRRFLDDVYGLIDGVKNGLGCAVVPLHLIEKDPDVEILSPDKVLLTEVWLQFYQQSYYTKMHEKILTQIKKTFHKKLRQTKSD